MTMTSEH